MNTEDQYMNITARVRCGSSGDPVCEPIDVAHVTSCHMAGVCAEVRKARRETIEECVEEVADTLHVARTDGERDLLSGCINRIRALADREEGE